MRLVFLAGLSMALGGCSLFLGEGGDGDGDGDGDCTDAPELELSGPLVEGQGADLSGFAIDNALASPPRVIGLRHCEPLPADLAVDPGDTGVEVVDLIVNGNRAALSVRVPIDTSRGAELSMVSLTFTDGAGAEVVSVDVPVEFLPELDGALAVGRFSIAKVTSVGQHSGPVALRSSSVINLVADLDLEAALQAAGPGGGAGGLAGESAAGPGGGVGGSEVGKCAGGGGGNASAGLPGTNHDGGEAIDDEAILGPAQPHGGGGGGGCTAGAIEVVGGGGGGFLELSADGGLLTSDLPIISVRGGPGETDNTSAAGGGGAGGTVLIRASQLVGALVLDLRGGAGGAGGGGQGADGRMRVDLGEPITPVVQTTRSCSDLLCVVGADNPTTFSGIRLVAPGGVLSASPIAIVAAADDSLTHDIDIEIDGNPAFAVSAGDSFAVDRPGVHRVCAVNLAENGVVINNADWRQLAESCIDVAYIPAE